MTRYTFTVRGEDSTNERKRRCFCKLKELFEYVSGTHNH